MAFFKNELLVYKLFWMLFATNDDGQATPNCTRYGWKGGDRLTLGVLSSPNTHTTKGPRRHCAFSVLVGVPRRMSRNVCMFLYITLDMSIPWWRKVHDDIPARGCYSLPAFGARVFAVRER